MLKIGRAYTSGKECLPLILTTGTLLNYVNNGRRSDEILVYFMVTGSGPCRFGQYYIFMEELIKRLELPDVALFSLSSENAYAGMGTQIQLKAWQGIVTADLMEDIRSMILANAQDPQAGLAVFNEEVAAINLVLEKGDYSQLESQLMKTVQRLKKLPMKRPPHQVPTITLLGEIFVRKDALSRQYITERLAKMGFAGGGDDHGFAVLNGGFS